MKKRVEKLSSVRNSNSVSWRARLFWPVLALLFISPVLAWKLTEKHIEKSDGAEPTQHGPWGELEYVPLAIEIPDQFVTVDQVDETDWFFRNFTREQSVLFLQTCDLTEEQLAALQNQARWNSTEDGCHVAPEDEWIENLSATSRGKIYAALAAFPENINQTYAFSYRPERLKERLEFSGLRESTIALFKKMLYEQGAIVRFADTDVVLRSLTSQEERLRFVKTVTRRNSLLVKLKITPQSNIAGLLEYWGAGGRSKDLRPLLESLARVPEGCKIDIAHLLPPFARQRIYTFPQPNDDIVLGSEDCHWTALNFFNDRPTAAFSSPEAVGNYLETAFTEIGSGTVNARFGDVICLKTAQGIIVHSAVYIADEILFSKNGAGLNQPWIYIRFEDMLPHYMMPNDTLRVVTYRKKQI